MTGPAGARRREGSRLLLALALVAGIAAAVFAGGAFSGLAADLLGISSVTVRLTIKVLAIAAALPAGFYLVERIFLARSSRDPED